MRQRAAIVATALLVSCGSTLAYAHGGHTHDSGKPEPEKRARRNKTGFTAVAAVGASYSKPLSDPPAADAATDVDPAPTFLLHSGEDHSSHDSGGGTTGSDAGGEGFSPYALVGAGYQLGGGWNTGLNLAVGSDGGAKVGDPNLTVGRAFGSRPSWNATVAASVPTSQASRDIYKITTLSVSGGPSYLFSGWNVGVNASASASWYKKTIIVDEAAPEEEGAMLSARVPASFLHEEGEDPGIDEPEEESPTLGTGNREFNRAGVSATVGHRLWQSLRADAGAGLSIVKLQFGKPFMSLDLTILQLSYAFGP